MLKLAPAQCSLAEVLNDDTSVYGYYIYIYICVYIHIYIYIRTYIYIYIHIYIDIYTYICIYIYINTYIRGAQRRRRPPGARETTYSRAFLRGDFRVCVYICIYIYDIWSLSLYIYIYIYIYFYTHMGFCNFCICMAGYAWSMSGWQVLKQGVCNW